MFDIKVALEKVDAATMKAVYVFFSAECWAPNEVQEAVFHGRALTLLSDHIIAHNLLHSLEITANVNMIEYEVGEHFATIDEALRSFVESYALPTSRIESLREHLERLLVKEPDGLWYRRRKKVAAIWWTK